MTTRDGFGTSPGRTIGIAESKPNLFEWDTTTAPPVVENGTNAHQVGTHVYCFSLFSILLSKWFILVSVSVVC